MILSNLLIPFGILLNASLIGGVYLFFEMKNQLYITNLELSNLKAQGVATHKVLPILADGHDEVAKVLPMIADHQDMLSDKSDATLTVLSHVKTIVVQADQSLTLLQYFGGVALFVIVVGGTFFIFNAYSSSDGMFSFASASQKQLLEKSTADMVSTSQFIGDTSVTAIKATSDSNIVIQTSINKLSDEVLALTQRIDTLIAQSSTDAVVGVTPETVDFITTILVA